MWDAATGKVLAVLRGHEDDVQSAVFSPAESQMRLVGHPDDTPPIDVCAGIK